MRMHAVNFEMTEDAYQEVLAYSRELGLSIDTMVSNAFAGYMEAVRLGIDDEPFEEWAAAIANLEEQLRMEASDDQGAERSSAAG